MRPLLLLLVTASAASFAEEKTLTFQRLSTTQDLQEVATIVRAIVDIPQATLEGKSLKVLGTSQQVATAEWILRELDQPTGSVERSIEDDDRIHILTYAAARDIQELQEAATLVRSMGEIRRLFTFNDPRKIVLRGTKAQIEQASWILQRLPATGPAAPAEMKLSSERDPILRIYSVPQFAEVRDFQWAATAIRSTAEIRYFFTYNPTKKLAARGTAEQMAMLDFMLSEFSTTTSARYQVPKRNDYLKVFDASKFAGIDERATLMRSMMDIRRVFTYTPGKKIIARGSKEELDSCDWLMQDGTNTEFPLGLIRKFHLPFTSNVQELQEAGTMLRSTAEIRRVFAENETKMVVVRGSQAEIDFAAWIFGQLANPPTSGQAETKVGTDIVKLLFLKPVDMPLSDFWKKVTDARRESKIPRVFTYNTLRAVVMRGSAEQIAKAESLLR